MCKILPTTAAIAFTIATVSASAASPFNMPNQHVKQNPNIILAQSNQPSIVDLLFTYGISKPSARGGASANSRAGARPKGARSSAYSSSGGYGKTGGGKGRARGEGGAGSSDSDSTPSSSASASSGANGQGSARSGKSGSRTSAKASGNSSASANSNSGSD